MEALETGELLLPPWVEAEERKGFRKMERRRLGAEALLVSSGLPMISRLKEVKR